MNRIIATIAVVLGMGSGIALAQEPEPTPLMLNPGFEIEAGRWPTEWSVAWGDRKHFEWASDYVRSGTHSLKFTGTGCVESPAYPYNGEVITVSGWLKLDSVVQTGKAPRWRRVGIQLGSLDANRKPNGHKTLVLALGTRDWTHHRKRFVFPTSTEYFVVKLVFYSPCEGTAWFDDVEISRAEDWYNPDKRPFDKANATVSVDAARVVGKLPDLWRHVDNSYMTRLLLPENVSVLPLFQQAGFRSMRFHETIHGTRIYREIDGRPVYNWERFDAAIDLLTRHGMKPFIVLESTPSEMAAEKVRSYRNISKVVDLDKWEELIFQIVKHCVEKYGREEVCRWHFELWNEPNARGYYKGTLEDYLRMYDYTVRGATRAEPGVKIGGCGGAGNSWILPLAEHCANGTNAATGGKGARIDFFSWHIYCAGVGLPNFNTIGRSITQVKQQLSRFPEFKDKPLIISEWSCNSSPCDWLDTSYRGPFIFKALLKMHEMGIERAHSFVVCDHQFYNDRKLFTRTLGFFTCVGVPKAPFHVFAMLNRLTGMRVAARTSNEPIDCLAAFDERGRTLRLMLGNYVEDSKSTFSTGVALKIRAPVFAGKRVRVSVTRVTPTASNAYDEWAAMGKPQVTRPQLVAYRAGKRETDEQRKVATLVETLKARAALAPPERSTLQFDGQGRASLELAVPVFSVFLVELKGLEG